MQQCFFFFCSIQHIILSPWEFLFFIFESTLFVLLKSFVSKRDLVQLSFTFDQIYQIKQNWKRSQFIVIRTVSKGSSHNDNFFSSLCWVFLGYLYCIESLRLNILGELYLCWILICGWIFSGDLMCIELCFQKSSTLKRFSQTTNREAQESSVTKL